MDFLEPNTVAFIPDGNRRFSKKLGLKLGLGYTKGFGKAEEALKWCTGTKNIKNIVFYAMSIDNFMKRALEKRILVRLFGKYFDKMAEDGDIHEKEVRVNVVGRKELFPPGLNSRIDNLEQATAGYDRYKVYICLGYDGRAEIVDAVNSLLNEGVTRVDEGILGKHMYSDIPDPDLVVRTGATSRLSGFLMWQTPYSELYFTDKLWPEFTHQDFDASLDFYRQSIRNFGR